MNSSDQLRRENEALRDRISRLSAASLRISASLDLNTVLHEVAETARELTGARYGIITTIDDSGQVQNFVTSGFTPDEHQQLAAWPDGTRLCLLFIHPRRPEPDQSPICRDYACMISSFVRARPWARPQTQTLSC